jgi:orotidine-5'-phosphate decarboxylase
MSLDLLIKKIKKTGNPTVAGLDPDFDKLPEYIKEAAVKNCGCGLDGAAEALYIFNKGLIDALCDVVPAVKPQCAYYEKYGWQGMRTLAKTISYAKSKGMFVITDAKRNDIGSTMEAYGYAHLGSVNINGTLAQPFAADAMTVNGYLGTDGIAPLINICKENNKGIFVLVKTSNPSSGELQDKKLSDGTPIYEYMGGLCEKWGESLAGEYGYSGVGAVVGATYPKQLTELRKKLPHTFFLVPGYGAQGGGAADVAGGFDKDGLGAVVNASRSIMYAYKKEGCDERDYAAAARREAIRMRNDITSFLG